MSLFISTAAQDPFLYFSWVLIVAFSICLHEYAHALTALRYGDDTAARSGHLSLNPMVQMGPMSLLLLLVFGIAWGAVPVNPYRFRRSEAALVSFAGPAANLLLCLVFSALTIASALLPLSDATAELVGRFFQVAARANGVLFVLNMLPIPMFDGWTVGAMFFPRMADIGPAQAQQISMIALIALWMTPLGDLIWYGGAFLASQSMTGWYNLFSLLT